MQLHGEPVVVRPPQDMTWQEVMSCIKDVTAFIHFAQLPGMSLDQARAVQRSWIEHFGLTADDQVTRRLAGVMSRFSGQLEADFPRHYPGVGPADLWRARKWRTLLNLIDHLPQNTHYHHALMHDEDHAAAVAQWKADHPDEAGKSTAPPWQVWSPEVEALNTLIDEIRLLTYYFQGANGGKPKQPQFQPRPSSEIKKATDRVKWKAHESLASKMLRRKTDT